MAGRSNVPIARALVLIAILIQIIAIIFELLNLASFNVSVGSFNGVLAGVIHEFYTVITIIISLIFLLINYSVIYLRMHRKKSKARDYCLLFGIIEIVIGFLMLPELMTIAGFVLILAWVTLEI